MVDLFQTTSHEDDAPRPLADRLRPRRIDDIVGQDHLVGSSGTLRRMVESGHLSSMILWGPPGCGKTTLARILADHTELHFEPLSAIFSGVGDLRKVFDSARLRRQQGRGTLLFVDEIHRFNKAQQDAFLPVVEDGTVTLIGATTENPSFELNAALLSRCQVMVLKRLDDAAIDVILTRAEDDAGHALPLDADARSALKAMADGDGRYALTMAEQVLTQDHVLDTNELSTLVNRRAPLYDKGDDGHYNLISALHKSVRGSDADAALYWFCRMLDGGEDPRFIARRMARMAVEDIGLADPQAMTITFIGLGICMNAWGSPEGGIGSGGGACLSGDCPKIKRGFMRPITRLKVVAKQTGSLMPPAHILNAPTTMMKNLGYGKGYAYDHDTPEGFSGQDYFPETMAREQFYTPVERGFEREIKKRLDYWAGLRQKRKDQES